MKKPITKLGEVERTQRGFEIVYFTDRSGDKCSLQQSSAADYEQPGISAVWLGIEDADPQIMASAARGYGVRTQKTEGWVPYPIPDAVCLSTRMHLDREQVAALIPMLKSWLKNGTFETKD